MRQTHFAIAMLICVVSITSVLAQTSRPSLQTYKNVEYGFQMDYLSTWKPGPGTRPWMVTRFSPSSPDDPRLSRAAIGIPTVTVRPIVLDDVATVMIAEMKLIMPDATIGIASNSSLGGKPARRMIMTGNSAGTNPIPLRALIIATIHNEKPYVVGICAPVDEWDRLSDGFDRLTKSFTFIEPAAK